MNLISEIVTSNKNKVKAKILRYSEGWKFQLYKLILFMQYRYQVSIK